MGVNLGAAMSPLLCGYIGETYGWHWGFGLATAGMLTGVAIFCARPADADHDRDGLRGGRRRIALLPARQRVLDRGERLRGVVAGGLGGGGVRGLGRGGVPAGAGAPPDPARLRRPLLGPLSAEWLVYLGVAAAIPVFLLLVSGFAPLTVAKRPVTLVADSAVAAMQSSHIRLVQALAVVVQESSRPAGFVLMLAGLLAFLYIIVETCRLPRIPRQRMYVVLILTFFSMLFWSFFEQAGSSLNNFTDRNVDRVVDGRAVTADEVGRTIEIQPTQKQLAYHNGPLLFTLDALDKLREEHKHEPEFTIPWKVTPDDVGMQIADRVQETPASTYQSVNAIFILLFGLAFTALWGFWAAAA